MRSFCLALAIVCAVPVSAHADTISYTDIVIETQTRQSAWGPGDANRIADTKFLGPDPWNVSDSFGTILGGPTRLTFPNPKRAVWNVCNLIPFAKCGAKPPATISKSIDTSTGAEAEIATAGRAGLELHYALDAGSVGAQLNYNAAADIPDSGTVKKGEFISLSTTAELVNGSLDSQSPTAQASVDVVADIVVEGSTRGCLAGKCAADNTTLLKVEDFRKELISIDPNEIRYLDGFLPDGIELTTPLLNQTTSLEADLVTRKLDFNFGKNNDAPTKENIVDSTEPSSGLFSKLAELEVKAPILELAGTKKANEDNIAVDGVAEFINLRADIDGLLTYAGALPPLGVRADFGDYISGSLDIIDIFTGPTLGVFQTFDMTQTLMAELSFSRQVNIAGVGLTDTWSGIWENLPDFAVFGNTEITPTFYTEAMLHSVTGFDFGIDFGLDILKGDITVGAGKVTAFKGAFGPVADLGLDNPISLGRVSLFDDKFSLGGFNRFTANSFMVGIAGSGTGAAAVPLPAGALLLLSGLGMMFLRRRTVRTV